MNNYVNIFVAVNYDTSNLVGFFIDSIKKLTKNYIIVIVDNFSNEKCRSDTKKFAEENIFILENENVGYGKGLNDGVLFSRSKVKSTNSRFYLSNIDIEYQKISSKSFNPSISLIPLINNKQKKFISINQKHFLGIHFIKFLRGNVLLFYIKVLLLKTIAIIPSKEWTIHGSCFVLDFSASYSETIFNKDSFLYSEELEFGSYLGYNEIKLNLSEISYKHIGSASIEKSFNTLKNKLVLFENSLDNWKKRWKV
jgi:GT2 family glycosyltransferase